MVKRTGIFLKDGGKYMLQIDGELYDCPLLIVDDLNGEYRHHDKDLMVTPERFVGCNLEVVLAGVTDSLRMVDENAYHDNSFIVSISNVSEDQGSVIDTYTSATDFESYHIIHIERDKDGDDSTLHAYLKTISGELRVRFPEDARLDARRNNRRFWVEKYKIQEGSAGGQHVIPLSDLLEVSRSSRKTQGAAK